MRWARAAWLTATFAMSGCGSAPAGLSESWSGAPVPDPVPDGEPCEAPWFECVGDSYCDVPRYELPVCEGVGTCTPPPTECEPASSPAPVCGCDGEIYEHECAAAQAGVNIQLAELCPAPAGLFPCGADYCDVGTQYCEHTIGHGGPEMWGCRNLACEPGQSGCACIESPSPCGDPEWYPGQWCDDLVGGGTEVTCLPA